MSVKCVQKVQILSVLSSEKVLGQDISTHSHCGNAGCSWK